jgi:hypothetical protein
MRDETPSSTTKWIIQILSTAFALPVANRDDDADDEADDEVWNAFCD